MEYKRDTEGQFTNKRQPLGKWQKRGLLAGIVLAGAMIGGNLLMVEPWVAKNQNEVRASMQELHIATVVEAAEIETPDRLDKKIRQLKDEVLDGLQKCESGGRKEEDGIVVLDSNDKGSYGPFQWQRTSYMHYYEKMTGQKISGRDAIIHALQTDKARALAEYVIFETPAGVSKDWVICSRNYGLQSKVDIIKELMN